MQGWAEVPAELKPLKQLDGLLSGGGVLHVLWSDIRQQWEEPLHAANILLHCDEATLLQTLAKEAIDIARGHGRDPVAAADLGCYHQEELSPIHKLLLG